VGARMRRVFFEELRLIGRLTRFRWMPIRLEFEPVQSKAPVELFPPVKGFKPHCSVLVGSGNVFECELHKLYFLQVYQ